ncbi:MAG: polysaccharide biosynthesis C-terminal domain-containing protein [Clostridia bacterium]|nr:polysaccharide biosynthesis C-terminal domain-containing protein [Clostridia bacterium]
MKRQDNKMNTRAVFETMPVWRALATMAIPTIVSNLITLVYNIADTFYIARTNNAYMVAASSLVLTVFLMTTAIANLFGVGGGTLAVRLFGTRDEEEARKVASLSLVMATGTALLFSLLCLIFMNPLLHLLGASADTIGYAKQYLICVVVIGGVPTVLSATMSSIVRNVGYSKKAAFGLGLGGVLNVVLDPLFMFVLLPAGNEVLGAALATMLSNVCAMIYFLAVYKKLSRESFLELPRRIERIRKNSLRSLFSVGFPAAAGVLLFDVSNMVLNRLAASHGDFALAAIGIVLKVERLPLNIGIGIALGMVPLVAYNYASKNYERMRAFTRASMISGLCVAAVSVVLYRIGAEGIIHLFIEEPITVSYAVPFLEARCVATPFMFASFHLSHFMQAIDRGVTSLWMAVIRQLCLNIPFLFLLNFLFGMTGIVWTQFFSDIFNVLVSLIIYRAVTRPFYRNLSLEV